MSERLRYRSVTERLDETTTGSFRRPVVSTGRTGSAVVSSRPYGRSGGSQPIRFVTDIATHQHVQSAKSYLFCCVGASDLSARCFYIYSLPEVVVESRHPVKEPELREKSEQATRLGSAVQSAQADQKQHCSERGLNRIGLSSSHVSFAHPPAARRRGFKCDGRTTDGLNPCGPDYLT